MGKGASSQVVQYVPVEAQPQEPIVTPAIQRDLSVETERAQEAFSRNRQQMSGISSTYMKMRKNSSNSEGGETLGGN